MKLAEALILRANAQKRMEQLKQRILRNAKVQEGDTPSENPEELLREFESAASELIDLMQRINRTNSKTSFQDSSLSDALAKRDVLRMRISLYRDLAQAASITDSRYSRSEVKFSSAVPVARIQKEADLLAKEHRELDARIQEANWLVELSN